MFYGEFQEKRTQQARASLRTMQQSKIAPENGLATLFHLREGGRQGRFRATGRADGCRGCGDRIKPVRMMQKDFFITQISRFYINFLA